MKKALSLILAIAMLLTMTVGFGSSAEVKNFLPLDEEGTNIIHQTAYAGSFGPNGSITLPAFGSWIADGEKIDGGWFPSDYMDFDTENVKFGTKSIKLKIVDKAKPHETAQVWFNSELLEPNKTYTFQAYVKTQKVLAQEGAAVGVEAKTFDHTAVPGFTDVRSELVTGTKDWTLISISFTMPDTNVGFGINCSVMLWAAMAGTAWFDGLALVEGDAPVADYASLTPIEYGSAPAEPTPAPAGPTLNGEPSAWAKEEILKALEADLVPAHVNSNYTTDITRSDFCDLIIKMIEKKSGKAIADVIAGYAEAKSEVSFPDTDSANVIAAAKLGIVNGRSSGAFDPTANITRQEAAKMLALAAKVLGADITASEVAFADADDIYAWAKEFIYYVNTIGVMNGTSTTTPPNFSPLRTYTREQSILTVYRLFNAI
ncbi:MAG: hypothetical protein E7491_01885 [Ruminococcaceae bacterium]|nr:hypothetical protein [Oscillospiraceae bacterium]